MVRTTSLALSLFSALALASPARAGDCKPVYGFYSSQAFFPPQCPADFCTAGDLVGGIQATYGFVATRFVPAAPLDPADPALAAVVFYVGESDVATKRGDHVYATDAGVIDQGATGKQAALLVITGGTGAYEGATGYLQLRGTLGPDGRVTGDYLGELCTAR